MMHHITLSGLKRPFSLLLQRMMLEQRMEQGFYMIKPRVDLTNAHMSGYGTGLLEVAFKGHDFVPAHPVYIDAELDFAVLKINQMTFLLRQKM